MGVFHSESTLAVKVTREKVDLPRMRAHRLIAFDFEALGRVPSGTVAYLNLKSLAIVVGRHTSKLEVSKRHVVRNDRGSVDHQLPLGSDHDRAQRITSARGSFIPATVSTPSNPRGRLMARRSSAYRQRVVAIPCGPGPQRRENSRRRGNCIAHSFQISTAPFSVR